MELPFPQEETGETGLPPVHESRVAAVAKRLSAWKGRIAGVLLMAWMLLEALTLPFGEITEAKYRNPTETEFMRLHAERARQAGKPFQKIQSWIPLRDIPPVVVNAIIVSEDGTFWRHSGFDWYEFKESVVRNLTQGRVARGASTITQQVVKNLYLSPSKNPVRKLREWVLTWWMEQQLSKGRILELYLNVMELGDGIYGVQAASRTYFGKDVTEITREEAARLASIIPNPRRHRPDETSRYISRRADLILERMSARGM